MDRESFRQVYMGPNGEFSYSMNEKGVKEAFALLEKYGAWPAPEETHLECPDGQEPQMFVKLIQDFLANKEQIKKLGVKPNELVLLHLTASWFERVNQTSPTIPGTGN